MKKSTIILGLSILFANDNNISQEATTENNLSAQKKELEFKKKELELKEKELELKKKELELKEKELKISQVEPHRNEISKKIPISKKELTYFKLAYFSGSVDFSVATDNKNYDILKSDKIVLKEQLYLSEETDKVINIIYYKSLDFTIILVIKR